MAKIAVWEFEHDAVFDGQNMYAEAAPHADRPLESGTLECTITPYDIGEAVLISNGSPEREARTFEVTLGDTGALTLCCSNGGVAPIRLATPDGFAFEGEELQITLTWGQRSTFTVVNLTRLGEDPNSRSAGFAVDAPWRARVRIVPGALVTFASAHGGLAPFFNGRIHKVTISDSVDDPTVRPPSASIHKFDAHRRTPISPRRIQRHQTASRKPGGNATDAILGQRGVWVATSEGERAIGSLVPGDEILTRDNGMQPLRWIGRAVLDWAALKRKPYLRPVVIRRGALGDGLPEADLALPPHHRLIARYGAHEALLCVRKLTGQVGIFEADALGISYTHLQFDQSEIYMANGVWVEAFNPGDNLKGGTFDALRAELCDLFPELDGAASGA